MNSSSSSKSQKPLRVAIQGYGRIGRMLHRQLIETPLENIEIVTVNARSSDNKTRAHLLEYDSVHGKCKADISFDENHIIANGKKVVSTTFPNALDCPWKDLEIDVVVETTGKVKKVADAQNLFDAGAKKVLVSAPMKDDTTTIVLGVNGEKLTDDLKIFSNASCTTNCIAPPLKVLHEKFGIENAYVTSIHSFTHSQNLLDNSAKDLRRARGATQSFIPTTSGATDAINRVLPDLKGKVDGLAIRVPISTSSLCDIRFVFDREVSAKELNDAILEASESAEMKGILGYTEKELVSVDFKTTTESSILDATLTKANGKYAQMMFWYDNEWGYVARLVNVLQKLAAMQ